MIKITTHNYTGEYNFSTCCPKGAYSEAEESRSYQINGNALTEFIIKVTGYLVKKLINFGGDDDTFDNIPALLEETEQIMRLLYKAVQLEFHQALIIKACSCINETIKTVNEFECLEAIDAELQCILWTDREDKLIGQDLASLEIYNEDATEAEASYILYTL